MADAINMAELLAELPRRRRGKACIVLTQEADEQKTWAAKLAGQTASGHIDLLDLFAEDEDLSSNTATYGVDKIFSLLREHGDKPVLIVTGLEFLFASWSGQSNAMEQFAQKIEFWSRSPALVFVTQECPALAKRKFDNRFQYVYVVDQRDTLAL